MIDRLSSEEIASAVRTAAHELFSTMLQLPLQEGVSYDETAEPESLDGVVALVGIAGSWTGTGRIECSPRFACRLAGAMLMQPYEAVNEDVLDAVAEVSNMIIGNVKNIFEDKLGPLALSVPTVIFGRNYRTHSSGLPKWTVVPFQTGEDSWTISFCVIPTKPQATQASRPEVMHVA
jgi:chemotaxis protein CheX